MTQQENILKKYIIKKVSINLKEIYNFFTDLFK